MGCCVGKDDGANEDVLQDLESGSVDASEHDEFGDESKTRGFWKDNRAVMIVLAFVCVAAFASIAYKVYASRAPSGSWTLTVSTDLTHLSDKPIELKVESGDLVNAVKAKIQEKLGYTAAEQRLIFKGKQLQDDRTLADYNIQNGSIIHLILRKRVRWT
eukprot:269186_1